MSSKAPANAPVPQPPAAPPTSQLEEFVETNFKTILIGFCAIVVVLIAWGVFSYMSTAGAEKAGQEAAAAKTVDDCDLVVQHHPGTVAAGNALLQKAKLLWDQNKKETSVGVLRDFVAKYSSHPFISQATLGLASRLEAMGSAKEVAEAKGLYETVVKNYDKTDVAALAQIRLADMAWSEGKVEDAKKIYNSLPQKLTGSPFFEYNETRLKWIAAEIPSKEVEAPKPPPDSIRAPGQGPGAASAPPPPPPPPGGLDVQSIENTLMRDIKPRPSRPLPRPTSRPTAIPARPKPGAAGTPGAGIPITVKPGLNGAPPTATSAPIKVEVPAPAAKPVPAPAPTPAPAAVPAVTPEKK